MADYATEANIEALLKSITFSATSKMTTPELAIVITDYSEYIDSRIAYKYDTPVTDAGMVKVLRIICKLLVGAEVIRTLKESIGMDENEQSIVSRWEKRAESMLDKIVNGELKFPDATSGHTVNLRQTGTTDDAGEDIEPTFEMDMEF